MLPADLESYVHKVFAGIHMWSDIRTDNAVRMNRTCAIMIQGHAGLDRDNAAISNLGEIAGILLEQYAENGITALEELLDSLAGRYALVVVPENGQFRVYHDAHGMRSVYFNSENKMVSSHAQLLADVLEASINENRKESNGLPLWAAWENTKFDQIKALIPNHCYVSGVEDQLRYYPRHENRYLNLNNKQRVELVAGLWQKQLDSYIRHSRIAMSVTAGLDSRVALALSEKHLAGIPSFTYTHDSGGYNSAESWKMDKDVVEQIKRYVPLDHTFLRYEDHRQPTDAQNQILSRNTLSRHGRWILSLYPKIFTDSSMLHLRSNSHETGRAFFPRKNSDNQIDRISRIIKALYSKSGFDEKAQDIAYRNAKDKSSQLGYGSLPSGFEALDLFYWEFRMGRWVSEVYNETDVCFDTFTPFNMRKIIEASLSFSLEERTDGDLFKELVNLMNPILNFFGVNSTLNLYELSKRNKTISADLSLADDSKIRDKRFREKSITFDFKVNSDNSEMLIKDSEFLFVPTENLTQGSFCGVERVILPGTSLTIEYLNKIARSAAKGYMEFTLRIDGRDVLSSDLTESGEVVGYQIANDGSNPVAFELRIMVLKNCKAESWSRASRTWIHTEITDNLAVNKSTSVEALEHEVSVRELPTTKLLYVGKPNFAENSNG